MKDSSDASKRATARTLLALKSLFVKHTLLRSRTRNLEVALYRLLEEDFTGNEIYIYKYYSNYLLIRSKLREQTKGHQSSIQEGGQPLCRDRED